MKSLKTKKINKIITIPFPYKKFEEYKKKAGIESEKKEINADQIKKIFLMTIKDFEKGTISIDELSSISEKLFNFMVKVRKLIEEEKTLFSAIESAAELGFYVRHPDSPFFKQFLEEVLDYSKTQTKMETRKKVFKLQTKIKIKRLL